MINQLKDKKVRPKKQENLDRIRKVLGIQPRTIPELVKRIDLSYHWTRQLVYFLHDNDLAHIVGYDTSDKVNLPAIYAYGPGKDVEKPKGAKARKSYKPIDRPSGEFDPTGRVKCYGFWGMA